MVLDPDILLLDESTSQLDPIAAHRFIDNIKRLNKEMGLTVIISEHRHEDIWSSADKICILHQGSVSYFGESTNAHNYINEFITPPGGIELYKKLNIGGKCPIDAGECRRYLSENFKRDICELPEKPLDATNTALSIKDVFFRYERNSADVLKKLNVCFKFGTITSILGGNGSGKTTLLSLISGVYKPYSGKIKKKCKF